MQEDYIARLGSFWNESAYSPLRLEPNARLIKGRN